MNVWKLKTIRYFFTMMVFVVLLAACPDPDNGTNSGLFTNVPSAPTNVSAEAVSSTSISVTWSSVSGAASYEVYYETGFTSISKLSTVTGTSYTHSGLQPDTFYKYYVTAKNSVGTSDFSSPAGVTTPLNDAGGQKPDAPTGVTASVESSTSIRIIWNPVSGATSYDVFYEIGYSSTKNFAANVREPRYIHTGLQSGTTYTYYIKAKNSAGDSDFSWSWDASATTPKDTAAERPLPPTNVTLALISSNSIRVSWDTVPGAKSYDIYYRTEGKSIFFVGNVNSPPYIHTDLSVRKTYYYYYIKAKNDFGESDDSGNVIYLD